MVYNLVRDNVYFVFAVPGECDKMKLPHVVDQAGHLALSRVEAALVGLCLEAKVLLKLRLAFRVIKFPDLTPLDIDHVGVS